MKPRRHGARAAAIGGVALALSLAGCEALLGPAFGDGAGFPSASPIATYTSGSATIAVKGGETIQLDKVAPGSGVDTVFGSNVRWTGPSGWNLRVNGAGANAGLGGAFGLEGGYLAFDRIADGQHWTTFDPTRCIVEIEQADAKGVHGTATCKGVSWVDALDQFGVNGPKEIDMPKFDAEVTFEAVP